VLLLYVGLVWCIVQVVSSRVASDAGADRPVLDPMSRVLALGIGATVGLQAVINVVVVTGMAPTKGIALPLISRGGTGWMMTALCLGMVIAMDRRVARSETQNAGGAMPIDGSSPETGGPEVSVSGGMPEPAEP
jgi:cell division protein FtsW